MQGAALAVATRATRPTTSEIARQKTFPGRAIEVAAIFAILNSLLGWLMFPALIIGAF